MKTVPLFSWGLNGGCSSVQNDVSQAPTGCVIAKGETGYPADAACSVGKVCTYTRKNDSV